MKFLILFTVLGVSQLTGGVMSYSHATSNGGGAGGECGCAGTCEYGCHYRHNPGGVGSCQFECNAKPSNGSISVGAKGLTNAGPAFSHKDIKAASPTAVGLSSGRARVGACPPGQRPLCSVGQKKGPGSN